MTKILLFLALLSLITCEAEAQLDSVYITSLPCECGVGALPSVITCNPVNGATYYVWNTVPGSVNAVMFNNMPAGSAQTSINSVAIECVLPQINYIVCVTAYNSSDSSNTFCDTITNIQVPQLSVTNNPIGAPGSSGIYSVASLICPAFIQYVWTITGDASFNNGLQIITTQDSIANVDFGMNFISGYLCVYGVTAFGLTSDTVCMNINTQVGIGENTEYLIACYHQEHPSQLIIEFQQPVHNLSAKIFDTSGRMALFQKNVSSTGNQYIIPAELTKGIYFLELNTINFRKTFKFVINN